MLVKTVFIILSLLTAMCQATAVPAGAAGAGAAERGLDMVPLDHGSATVGAYIPTILRDRQTNRQDIIRRATRRLTAKRAYSSVSLVVSVHVPSDLRTRDTGQ